MSKSSVKFGWDFGSYLLVSIFALLQCLHWIFSPQFIDIYYHLHTAWGFLQAGGVSLWDFWEYAPVGRPHIYPPFFHLFLSFLLNLGVDKVVLARAAEVAIPIFFILVLWFFVRRNFSPRFSFFVLIVLCSSYSFFVSLINQLPAAIALIAGILALHNLLNKRFFRAALLLILCAYTHIGVTWAFIFTALIYAILGKKDRKSVLMVLLLVIVFAFPLFYKQSFYLGRINLSKIPERYFCEFKILEYLFVPAALFFCHKIRAKFSIFICLFFASFIFLFYPYRYFSAQGYLSIIFLAAVFLDRMYEKIRQKKAVWKPVFCLFVVNFLFFSPTIIMERQEDNTINLKTYFFDSALSNLLMIKHNQHIQADSFWYPDEYKKVSDIILKNSQDKEIIYSSLIPVGVCLAALSARPCANGLFPEVPAARKFNPLAVSRIFVAAKDDPVHLLNGVIRKFNLEKIGETKMFNVYRNPYSFSKAEFKKAQVPFWAVNSALLMWLALYFFSGRGIFIKMRIHRLAFFQKN